MSGVRQQEEAIRAFKRARDRLRTQYGERGATKVLQPLFSPATLSRLLRSEGDYPSENIAPATRERLVWFFDREDHSAAAAFDGIKWLQQSELDRRIVDEEFAGAFRLFRLSIRGLNEPQLVEDRLRIISGRDGSATFELWSFDWRDEQPERTGMVQHIAGKFYLFGRGERGMSVMVFNAGLRGAPLSGLQLSVVGKLSNSPVASRVIAVREGDETLLEDLRRGRENAFYDLTGAKYASIMRAD